MPQLINTLFKHGQSATVLTRAAHSNCIIALHLYYKTKSVVLQAMLTDAQHRLADVTRDPNQYKKLLEGLIAQVRLTKCWFAGVKYAHVRARAGHS